MIGYLESGSRLLILQEKEIFRMSKAVDIKDIVIDVEKDLDNKVKPAKSYSSESVKSFDDTVRRVLTNAVEFKVRRRLEQKKKKKLEVVYLIVAVLAVLFITIVLVGTRIYLTGFPEEKKVRRPIPTHQWVMDWDPDFPESVVKERRVDMLWSSVYSFEGLLQT
jgi:hypothetical protein